jgi:hypothetical protein
MKRLGIAIAIALVIYGISVGVATVIYAGGWMPTGAAHNDCPDYRHEIAEEQGIDEEDVEQEQIKAATEACLAEHEREEQDVYRTALLWSIWPAVITGLIFLAWPVWTGILHRQEEADPVEGTPGDGPSEAS